jgi:hypothetical protein
MVKAAENPIGAKKRELFAALRAACEGNDWKRADKLLDELRFVHLQRYSDFAREFGAAQWERWAQAIDDAGAEEGGDYE